MASFLWILLFSVGFRIAGAKIYDSLSELEKSQFDFIICGGGNAGLVLANRLSENPAVQVLVIEAGGRTQDDPDTQIPFLDINLLADRAKYQWNTTTTPQKGLLGKTINYPRGFGLGGSTAHNGMIWIKGSVDDYDNWAKVTGDDGWSYNALEPYMKKVERFTNPTEKGPDFVNGKFNPQAHGFQGPLGISIIGNEDRIDDLVVEVLKSKEFNMSVVDGNDKSSLGIWWIQSSVSGGTRSSSATSYLDPIDCRPNLSVVINTQVTRVIQTKKGDFRTVEVAGGPKEPRQTFTACKEVILSAGVVGSAQLLLLSGIGHKQELAAVGVKLTHESPNVGKGLSNQPQTLFSWEGNFTMNSLIANQTFFDESLARWNKNHTGPMNTVPANLVSAFRLPENSTLLKGIEDPSAGPRTPHYYMGLATTEYFNSGSQPTIGAVLQVSEPISRGSVTLNSNDPFDQPNVDLAFLVEDLDTQILLQAYRTAKAQIEHPLMKGFALDRLSPPPEVQIDDDIIIYMRNNTIATSHAVGTAAMSRNGSHDGVVGPDLKVKGINGLRVVDASVFPVNLQMNNQAAVYHLAERASDLIKHEWHL
ncbi:hypothetical protein AGABI1DRAFT_105978 [Agaricus bisporus var. burnettii JB137-S8]|uniref:pyranose dehydrogenase (acceptor) n=2 Tax=Agaricus bisporus var. burnettii TaxID=192524 RepID=K5W327_AGABU|nr:uncharacterized protein AGABI1DRAFT_105978 [Agaricus bisporus var. burnettii JB137-S8]EKM81189.1 hypothetical protein AGABI1DRAFT_105978 [Agaricus bisporus var. burnettii JB137-S8]KAF7782753.1 CAZyme family AA3 [Agaricus bisporus var. burnettii]